MTNTAKYLSSTTHTMNGYVYKNEDAFNSGKGICYISEYGLQDLENALENGKDLTDEEIIERGIGETHETILKQIKDKWEELVPCFEEDYEEDDIPTQEEATRLAFFEADWEYISTVIEQWTY